MDVDSRWPLDSFRSHSHVDLDRPPIESVLNTTPFYYGHVRDAPLFYGSPGTGCRLTSLAVAVAEPDYSRAFIVQHIVERLEGQCNHEPQENTDLAAGDWRLIATLDGFTPGQNSLGNVLSISPNGTRIAISDWSQLRVWPLDPTNIDSAPYQLHFPTQDICPINETITLRHVQLPAQGVIHSMCWQDEDKLFAMTDRGLVSWGVGHQVYSKSTVSNAVLKSPAREGSTGNGQSELLNHHRRKRFKSQISPPVSSGPSHS